MHRFTWVTEIYEHVKVRDSIGTLFSKRKSVHTHVVVIAVKKWELRTPDI